MGVWIGAKNTKNSVGTAVAILLFNISRLPSDQTKRHSGRIARSQESKKGVGKMAAEKVNLTEAIRGNLLSLQRSARAIDQTQTRLSTGLAVNSALDDASAFFTAFQLIDCILTNCLLVCKTI